LTFQFHNKFQDGNSKEIYLHWYALQHHYQQKQNPMKKIICVMLHVLGLCATAQTPTYVFGTYGSSVQYVTRKVNLVTAAVTDVSTLATVPAVVAGETTYDATGNRYFHKSHLGISIFNATSGALITTLNPSIALKGIEYNPNTGAVVGTYTNSAGTEVFASLNLLTGVVSTLAVLNGASGTAQGESTFDAANNRYFNRTFNPGATINVINAATGVLISSFPNSLLKGFEYNPNSNKLVGTISYSPGETYCSMDLGTGAITDISLVSQVLGVIPGQTTFDATGNRYIFRPSQGFFVLNALTGAVQFSIAGHQTIAGMEYIGIGAACNLNVTNNSPSNVYATQGSNTSFSASASMTNTQFQWQSKVAGFGWLNLSDNSTYSGATATVLTVNGVTLQNHKQEFRAVGWSGSCADTSAISILRLSDSLITGVKTNITNELFASLYPNPANDYLLIEVGKNVSGNCTLTITDILGKMLHTQTITQSPTLLSLNGTMKGLIFVNIADHQNGNVQVNKIIVE
jgi:hypothetical protein